MATAEQLKSNGRIVYAGPSRLDGAPIVMIAIGFKSGSRNKKTGDMIQTYIMRSDIAPTDAVNTGDDASVCGDCIHRGTTHNGKNYGRTCYVNVGQGALSTFKSYRANKYPYWDATRDSTADRIVRMGTYGDPAAVPVEVWRELLHGCAGHTGYTHQWRNPRAVWLRTLCMASVDTMDEAQEAQDMGWRTFRVGLPSHPGRDRVVEALCPASAEAGKKLTCAQCLACSGAQGRAGSVYIPAHGGFAVMANIRRRDAALQVCNG